MNYNNEELNQMLLSKSISDFYFAVIEKREGILTEKEYNNIIKKDDNVYTESSKEDIDNAIELITKDERLNPYKKEITRLLYSFCKIRYSAVITLIDDDIYDIANREFVDIKNYKIINYCNMINYYDGEMAALILVNPNQEPKLNLKHPTVLINTINNTPFNEYVKTYVNQDKDKDLTASYIREVRSISKGFHL